MDSTSPAVDRKSGKPHYRLILLLAAGLTACLLLLGKASEVPTLALAAIATVAFVGVGLELGRRQDSERHALELTRLLEISNALHTTLDYVAIVKTVLSGSRSLVYYDRGVFYRSAETGDLSVVGTQGDLPSGRDEDAFESSRELVTTSGATGKVQTRRTADIAEVAIPIFARERVEGVLLLQRSPARPFTDDDLRLLLIVVGQLAAGIEKALLHEQVRQDAIRDSLTGLYNHGYLLSRLVHEIERSRRLRTAVSFLMIEIDSFKKVNDVYGHLTGDAVVKEVAKLFSQHSRKVDLVGRYGGDEFGIILPDTDLSRSLIVAERLRQLIESHVFSDAHGQPIAKITVTIGAASYPTGAADPEDLIAQADAALYRGKANGKNQVCTAPDFAVFPASIPARQ